MHTSIGCRSDWRLNSKERLSWRSRLLSRRWRAVHIGVASSLLATVLAAPIAASAQPETGQLSPGVEVSGTSSTGGEAQLYQIFVPAGATLHIEGSLDILDQRDESIFNIDPLLSTLQGDPRGGGPFLNIPFSRSTRDPASVSGDVTLAVYQHERIFANIAWRFTPTVDCNGSPCDVSPTRVVTTPDLKIVQFLQIPLADCVREIRPLIIGGRKQERALAACGFLVGSSNPDPPADLSGAAWERFVASKEFRGFVHLPSFKVSCDSGVITSIEQQGVFGISSGWTPILLASRPGRLIYEKAEPFRGQEIFALDQPAITESLDKSSAIISVRSGARIAKAARAGQYGILHYDAPYIWTATHVKISCDGEVLAVAGHSDIPRVAAYVDNRLVGSTTQSLDLQGFVKSGGRLPSRTGQGKLAPGCDVLPVYELGRGGDSTLIPTCKEVIASGGFTPTV